MTFDAVGIAPANLMLPREDVNPTAWACLACDQYTAQPEYWAEAALEVGSAPSTLHMMIPECDLASAAARTPAIHQTMRAYLDGGILREAVRDGFVLVERGTRGGERVGLVCAVDLEQYDLSPAGNALVRPTEETIAERLPARMALRQGAPLEMSHILLLMDDVLHSVVEPLHERRRDLRPLYDFPLMKNGGHLRGWAVDSEADKAAVLAALSALKARLPAGAPLLVVGDGNHSLAAAKAYWETCKRGLSKAQQAAHPARWALCEIENIHDDALTFAPIHRLLTGVDGAAVMADWTYYCDQHQMDLSEVTAPGEQEQTMRVVYGGHEAVAAVSHPDGAIAAQTLQRYLDDFLRRHPEARLDYIHGDEALRALCQGTDAIGFLMPEMDKARFFDTVRRLRVLPRKTFSLGGADEKRFYMECRRLTP